MFRLLGMMAALRADAEQVAAPDVVGMRGSQEPFCGHPDAALEPSALRLL